METKTYQTVGEFFKFLDDYEGEIWIITETKTYQTVRDFFKVLNDYEGEIWIRGGKAYNAKGELVAEYNTKP